jgi:hypothetical protein
MITDTNKKKTSHIAVTTLIIGICASVSGLGYVGAYQEYWDSLRTNHNASELMGIFGMAWFILSAITFFAFLGSVARIVWSRGKLRGFTESVCALLVVLFSASLVMPTIGLAYSTQYKRQAGTVAWEYFEECKSNRAVESNTKSPLLSDYEVEIINNRSNYTEDPNIVEVVYTLKKDFGPSSYPRQFSVLLNFDTGEKSIKEVNSVEE